MSSIYIIILVEDPGSNLKKWVSQTWNYFWSFQIGFWLIWEISGFWSRGCTQNLESDLSSRTVWPGEPFWRKYWRLALCQTKTQSLCFGTFGKNSFAPKWSRQPLAEGSGRGGGENSFCYLWCKGCKQNLLYESTRWTLFETFSDLLLVCFEHL